MTSSKLLLLAVALVTLPLVAQDGEPTPREVFKQFLAEQCDAPILMGPPAPLDEDILELHMGCAERFGMTAPCLHMLVKIKHEDGSFDYKARCGPMKGQLDGKG